MARELQVGAVHATHRPNAELMSLAALQSGVLTIVQVRGHGLGRRPVERLVAEGHWTRMSSGLYLTAPGEPDWSALAWGGVLIGGPAARLGGTAALHATGIGIDPPDPIQILVPHGRTIAGREPWEFRRERPGVRDRRSLGSPPRLPVEDAVLDACADLAADAVVTLLTTAVRSRQTTARRLIEAVHRRDRLRWRGLLLDVLHDAAEGAESALEVLYLNDVERAHGLPRGVRQARSRHAAHIRDVLYEEFGVVTELDGRLGHEGTGRFRDMDRDNVATITGELTLRYGWADVTGRPCRVAQQVGLLLVQRGWPGPLGQCSRCGLVPDEELWVS